MPASVAGKLLLQYWVIRDQFVDAFQLGEGALFLRHEIHLAAVGLPDVHMIAPV